MPRVYVFVCRFTRLQHVLTMATTTYIVLLWIVLTFMGATCHHHADSPLFDVLARELLAKKQRMQELLAVLEDQPSAQAKNKFSVGDEVFVMYGATKMAKAEVYSTDKAMLLDPVANTKASASMLCASGPDGATTDAYNQHTYAYQVTVCSQRKVDNLLWVFACLDTSITQNNTVLHPAH